VPPFEIPAGEGEFQGLRDHRLADYNVGILIFLAEVIPIIAQPR